MNSSWSVFVQVFSVIVVITIAITLMVALFSYIGYKVRQRKKPAPVAEEIPDFFVRYNADMFVPFTNEMRLPAGTPVVVSKPQSGGPPVLGGGTGHG